MPATDRKFADFNRRYYLEDGVPVRKSDNYRPKLLRNKETGYEFYRLTNNDGVRSTIGKNSLPGGTQQVGDMFFVGSFPQGRTRDDYPWYVFDYDARHIWRVAFKAPRPHARPIVPDQRGNIVLLDAGGVRRNLKFDDMFA